eukprot:157977-Amphidinium_carterae.1
MALAPDPYCLPRGNCKASADARSVLLRRTTSLTHMPALTSHRFPMALPQLSPPAQPAAASTHTKLPKALLFVKH